MTDIMLDLETLSSGPDAALLSIGATTFGQTLSGVRIYLPIDPLSDPRGEISASTVKWWAKQSDAARSVFNDGYAKPLDVALRDFTVWLKNFPDVALWGNGSDFDNVVLRRAYERAGIAAPWSFRQNRCYRTLKNLAPSVPFQSVGVAHNALDDAIAQAEHAEKILTFLGITGAAP